MACTKTNTKTNTKQHKKYAKHQDATGTHFFVFFSDKYLFLSFINKSVYIHSRIHKHKLKHKHIHTHKPT